MHKVDTQNAGMGHRKINRWREENSDHGGDEGSKMLTKLG
jgi:hypothetical protein